MLTKMYERVIIELPKGTPQYKEETKMLLKSDLMSLGYYVYDTRWTQGYISRHIDTRLTRVKVANGRRKGQLYVEVPSWESTQYHIREYLKPGITFEDKAVGALFWIENRRYKCTKVSGDVLTLEPTSGTGATIKTTMVELVKAQVDIIGRCDSE